MEKEVVIWIENLARKSVTLAAKRVIIKECDQEGKASGPLSAKGPDRRCLRCFKMEHLAWNCPEKEKSGDGAPQVNRIICNCPGCADCQDYCMAFS